MYKGQEVITIIKNNNKMKVTLQTIGMAKDLKKTVEFDTQKIANQLEADISGRIASENQASLVNQSFIDKYEIKARYASGTFLGFSIPEIALDEYETFRR